MLYLAEPCGIIIIMPLSNGLVHVTMYYDLS